MLQSNTVSRQLDVNVAVALRLVRKGAVPPEFFSWLAKPTTSQAPPARWVNTQLTDSLSAIVSSVSAHASDREKRQIETAPEWIGAISYFMADHAQTEGIHCMRLLAASLLPLYRTLATGKLQEGLCATQKRLSENLALLGLCSELGVEFRELLEMKLSANGNPTNILWDDYKLSLIGIGQTILRVVVDYDAVQDRFHDECLDEIFDCDSFESLQAQDQPSNTDWATPELLWRLAGELIAKKSEIVLPRSWIDTPVPWSKIAEHWNRLHHTLLTLSDKSNHPVVASIKVCQQLEQPSARSADAETEATLAMIREVVEQEITGNASPPTKLLETMVDDFDAKEDNIVSASPNAEPSLEAMSQGTMSQDRMPADACIPKVILAEIRSHNDPVFVNVVRRKLACCRTEERALCLSHIVVSADDESQMGEVNSVRANGLTLWQQKLVDWLADHPHVSDPYAFLTSDGELILCVLDLERNEMTSILRQGLVEVLTGKHVEDASEISLARVNIPARFHAGISATSSPGASMTAEQLIEPAIRCLSAAQRHGRASIKSIEVY